MQWNQGARLAALAITAAIVASGAGCQDLPDVAVGQCGNGVIEVGEDCEATFVDDQGRSFPCGAIGTADECLLECVEGACPDGYGCGADGTCRQASGVFERVAPLTLAVDDVATGDVDGDGFDDLVASSGSSVMVGFGSTGADLAATLDVQISTPAGAIALGDLDGNGTSDVLAATTPGVQTFLGADDRSLDPFSYPLVGFQPAAPILLGVATDLDPATVSDDVLLAWGDRIGFALAGGAVIRTLPDPTGPVPASAAALAGLPVARVTANYQSATPPVVQDPDLEIALGFVGTSEIFIFRAASNGTISDTGVVLDAGAPLALGSGLFFGDFDGDGCRDLVAQAGGGSGAVIVFRNVGAAGSCTGTFAAPVAIGTPLAGSRLFGTAELTGDLRTDLVTSAGLYRVTGIAADSSELIASAGSFYEGAQVVDINGDKQADVAAFRESQPDVEVLVNAGGGVFNRFVVATPSPVQRLSAGDFDGDLTDDIAFVELDASEAAFYTLSVAFGQFHGPPGPRVPMDRFASVAGVVSASVVGSSGEPDAVDDLVVVEAGEAEMHATVLFGSGARAMTSPLILMADSAQRPLAIVLGELDATAGLDLFAVGGDGTAFLFQGDGAGGFTLSETAPWTAEFGVSDAVWATGDLDDDGLEEVVSAERRIRDGGSKVLMFTPAQGTPADPTLARADGFSGAHTVAIADLDGDDDDDVLVTFDGTPSTPGAVHVGWNHDGVVDGLTPVAAAEGCIDAVPAVLDTDAQPELVALCRVVVDGKERFELRGFDAPEPDTLLPRSEVLGISLGGPSTRLLAGDIDGNGLDDLVVSTKGQEVADVRIFLQHDLHDLE